MNRVLLTGGSGFIGTHLLEALQARGFNLKNLDVRPPRKPAQQGIWEQIDVLDREGVESAIAQFQPDCVIHLAARTDTDGKSLEDYRTNIDGTDNMLSAIGRVSSVGRVIITSTQFVHGPGSLPRHDLDFKPHTAYGRSKVEAERLVRSARLDAIWTIVRPTNVWGPWHPRYPTEFWEILRKGLYFHPGGGPVIRSYGYVGNVVHQMAEILDAPKEAVSGKVFYLGDEPVDLYEWVQGFSKAINEGNVRTVPRPLLKALAVCGDMIRRLGIDFPIFSSRYNSMTQDYPTPMQPTLDLTGEPPYSMQEGIDRTIDWLKERGFFDGRFSQ